MLVINLVGKLWSTLISPFSLFGTYQIQRTAQSIFLFWNLLHQILPAVGALVDCSLEAFFVSELPPAFVPSIGISLHFSSLVRSHLSQLSHIHLGICLPGSSSLVPVLHTSCKAGGCKPQPRPFPRAGPTTTRRLLKSLNAGPTPRFWVRSSILPEETALSFLWDPRARGSSLLTGVRSWPAWNTTSLLLKWRLWQQTLYLVIVKRV